MGQDTPESSDAVAPTDVENQVVAVLAVDEILAGVVDDVVGTEGANGLGHAGAVDGSDLSAERLRQLDGVGSDTSGRADDQDLLARSEVADISERLERGDSGDGGDGSLLECGVGRLLGELVLFVGGLLRI